MCCNWKSPVTTLLKLLRQEMKELPTADPAPHIVKLEQELTSTHTGTAAGDLGLPRVCRPPGRKCMASPGWWITRPARSKPKNSRLKGAWTEQLEGGDKGKALQLVVYATMVLASLGPEAQEQGVFAAIPIGAQREGRACSCSRSTASASSSPITPKPSSIGSPSKLDAYVAEGNHVVHNSDAKYCEHCVVLDPKESFSF